jgi:hypothetical protein
MAFLKLCFVRKKVQITGVGDDNAKRLSLCMLWVFDYVRI